MAEPTLERFVGSVVAKIDVNSCHYLDNFFSILRSINIETLSLTIQYTCYCISLLCILSGLYRSYLVRVRYCLKYIFRAVIWYCLPYIIIAPVIHTYQYIIAHEWAGVLLVMVSCACTGRYIRKVKIF